MSHIIRCPECHSVCGKVTVCFLRADIEVLCHNCGYQWPWSVDIVGDAQFDKPIEEEVCDGKE